MAQNIEALRIIVDRLEVRVEDNARGLVNKTQSPNIGVNIRYMRARVRLALAEGNRHEAWHDGRALKTLMDAEASGDQFVRKCMVRIRRIDELEEEAAVKAGFLPEYKYNQISKS